MVRELLRNPLMGGKAQPLHTQPWNWSEPMANLKMVCIVYREPRGYMLCHTAYS